MDNSNPFLELRFQKKCVYGFRGRHGFLSNMAKLEKPIERDGISYPTVEHFYQAMKTLDQDDRKIIASLVNPGETKKYVQDIVVRDDWDDIHLKVMFAGICWKFSENNPGLLKKLQDTGDLLLLEANWWKDKYFGIDWETGQGENMLGRLLMKRRTMVRISK